MKILIETERLILREVIQDDIEGFWELDSDPEVHTYLGNNPVTSKELCIEVIKFLQKQYVENGIGRWAVIEKSSNKFIGWAGFKLIKEETNGKINYYDLGYRFIKQFWGRGYATEASRALINYAFETLNLNEIIAISDSRNDSSINVINKLGFKFIEKFTCYDREHLWFVITKTRLGKRNQKLAQYITFFH